MFAKLLKYEWRASKGILGVLSLAALGVGVMGTVVLRSLINNFWMLENTTQNEELSILLPTVLMILMLFLIFALFAYALGSGLFLLHRFYKNKFTDEGYLTFTLPVTAKQIFLSSFVNMALWMLIIGLVIMAAVVMMVAGGVASTGYLDVREAIAFYEDVGMDWGEMGLNLLSGVVSFAYTLVMAMTCVTIGAVAAKKHKLLAAFGIYYGISVVNGILQTVLSVLLMLSESMEITIYYLAEMGIQIVLTVVGFFLSTYLMEKKLNLP